MARPNYGAAKRTKELKKKAKREAKLARRHARKEAPAVEAAPGGLGVSVTPVAAPDHAPGNGLPRPDGGQDSVDQEAPIDRL